MAIRDTIINKLWRGKDLFSGFIPNKEKTDFQGWNSDHYFLTDSIDQLNPKIIVEVGVWKGGSTICMAKKIKEKYMDSVVISVDTWLGSWDQ